MPHAIFTSPEIAGVGATEKELKKSGTSYIGASVPFMNTTKGRAVKEEYGLCKLLVAPDHKILGCTSSATRRPCSCTPSYRS